jgi:hypothetical protein
MRKTLIAAAFGCLVAMPVMAKTYELPDANPAVVVTLPNSWKPTEVEKGVEATSPDGETYIALETATAKGMETLIDEDIKFLTDQGVVIDRSTQQTHDTTQNGMSVSFLRWSGKDKDGPTNVTLGIFGVSSNLVLLMTAWSSPAGEKTYDKEMTAIVSSIKPP